MSERGPEEDRMVGFGYFAEMAATQWPRHPAAEYLKAYGYDVEKELRELSEWCYGPGRQLMAEQDAEGG